MVDPNIGYKLGEMTVLTGTGDEKLQPHPWMKIITKARVERPAHGFVDLVYARMPFWEDSQSIDGSHLHVWLGDREGTEAILVRIAQVAAQHMDLYRLTWQNGLPAFLEGHRLLRSREKRNS